MGFSGGGATWMAKTGLGTHTVPPLLTAPSSGFSLLFKNAKMVPACLPSAPCRPQVPQLHPKWQFSGLLVNDPVCSTPTRPLKRLRREGGPSSVVAVLAGPGGAVLDERDAVVPTSHIDAIQGVDKAVKEKTEKYTAEMQSRTGDVLMYRHERGMNFHAILPDLIVGSCPQRPDDVDRLRFEEGVGAIICLQQDADLAYFGIDLGAIQRRCVELGGIQHIRHEIRDFDPFDLRMQLPDAVRAVRRAFEGGASRVYIHCTAGLGRAPGVALAYMYWLRSCSLEQANTLLQRVRPCHPKLDSIRAATCDLLTDGSREMVTLVWRARGTAHSVQIAGLDIGWHNRIALDFNRSENRWVLQRVLPVGRYQYKYIVDGRWTHNPDSPITHNSDGVINNYLEVVGDSVQSEAWSVRQRLMVQDATLTLEDRQLLAEKLLLKFKTGVA